MAKFTHYLVTRYNVRIPGWTSDKHGVMTLDADWMKHRLDIFRKFCVPTVVNQVNTDFHWIIYCDSASDAKDLEQIQNAVSPIPHAQIRLVASFNELIPDLHKLFASVTTPFIITSRVDNDDGIGPTYIKEIQDHFLPVDKMIINFTEGVLYDVHHRILTHIDYSPLNHFLSMIEENTPGGVCITVIGFPHGRPPEAAHVKNVPNTTAWLKIIHERNKVSRIAGKPMFSSEVMKTFNIDTKYTPIRFFNICIYVTRRIASISKRKIIHLFSSPS